MITKDETPDIITTLVDIGTHYHISRHWAHSYISGYWVYGYILMSSRYLALIFRQYLVILCGHANGL